MYDRQSAASYAMQYALKPNPCFPPFPNDCTSFVSQCLLAGGWTMIGGSFTDRARNDVWWWGKSSLSRASYTWGGAHNFWHFLSLGHRAQGCKRDDLDVGDVVQVASAGHYFHTMIVSTIMCSKKGSGPHLSYHTNNTLNNALEVIEAMYQPSGGYTVHFWKIAASFP